MPLTLKTILEAASKVEGDIHAQVANSALNELIVLCGEVGTDEPSEQIDFVDELDKEASQVMLVDEIDSTIAELIQFRELLVDAINTGKDEMADPKELSVNDSLFRAVHPLFTGLES